MRSIVECRAITCCFSGASARHYAVCTNYTTPRRTLLSKNIYSVIPCSEVQILIERNLPSLRPQIIMEQVTKEELIRARKRVTFDTSQLAQYIYGSVLRDRRVKVSTLLRSDRAFSRDDHLHLSREKHFQLALEKVVKLHEWRRNGKITTEESILARVLMQNMLPDHLHEVLFISCLETQGAESQANYWVPLAKNYSVIGCYAQTEIGHGSNLSNLETSATYIPETREFELHSPTLSSTKYWIGGAGVLANHALVVANLILNGKNLGPHQFLAQIRTFGSHEAMKGVELGDIGPKFGMNSIDNGYIRFSSYRIPRNNMMMRFACVTEDGQYIQPPHSKLSYAGMVKLRSNLVEASGYNLSKAITIAIRYCSMRKQFGRNSTKSYKDEWPVINHQMVQHRLFPILAHTYAIIFTGQFMTSLYNEMLQGLCKEDFNLFFVPIVHGMSSCLKSYCTEYAVDSIDIARRVCGGHGFLSHSGFPALFTEFAASVTYEGENSLLTQQVASFLLKAQPIPNDSNDASTVGARYFKMMSYIYNTEQGLLHSKDASPLQTPEHFIPMLAQVVTVKLQDLKEKLKKVPFALLNIECAEISKAFAEFVLSYVFFEKVREVESKGDSNSKDISAVMKQLYILHTLHIILSHVEDFRSNMFLNKLHIDNAKTYWKKLLKEIQVNAIGLVDAFELTDYELNSVLGHSSSEPYKMIMKSSQFEPLNKSNELGKETMQCLQKIENRKASRI